ncbi:MAG: hypothetical protein M1363_05630, partial [Gammaproteobacteria bacterium]|nr:hypothetical protein [Gammaproteobacteria bacterium]
MSVEFSGSGVVPEPIKQEQQTGMRDIEQTIQAVRQAISIDNAQQNKQVQAANELSRLKIPQ